MILYLLRHGIAEPHGSRASDDERELTSEGKEKTALAMKSVRNMRLEIPVQVITSPLIRARQTAEIAIREFAENASIKESTALVPSADIAVTMALIAEEIKQTSPLMLVGHEPHLSTLASALVGSQYHVIEMKKASLAVFELHRLDVPRLRGVLTALIPPKIANLS